MGNVFGTPAGKKGGWLSPLVAILFFAFLWLLDFPKPFSDDLFYCGAGLNLASGGDFANPLLARQHFPNHYFFVYPPIHSYAIAGWMKLFGISARSLTGFQDFMYALTALATLAVLRRHQAPAWLEFFVPLGVAAAFLPIGLRPEPLSVALAMTGFALIECGARRRALIFPAFLLMFLGGAAAPRLTLFAGALVLLAAGRLWQNSPAQGWRRWSFCFPCLGALLLTGLIFLLFIGFRPAEFWQTFHLHSQRLNAGVFPLLHAYFFELISKTQWLLFFLPWPLLIIALGPPRKEIFYYGLFIAATFFPTALIGGIGHGTAWYAVLAAFFLAASISRTAGRYQAISFALFFLAMFLANAKNLVNAAGILSGAIQSGPGGQYAAALRLRSTPEHPVLVDCAAARYVYDYNLPRGCLDFGFSAPFPGIGVPDFFQPQDVYVVSPANIELLKRNTYLDFPPLPVWSPIGTPRWPFVSIVRWWLDQQPCAAFVIPAESCRGLRPDAHD